MENKNIKIDELKDVSGGAGDAGGYFIYVVRKGDTLSDIAKKYHTTVNALVALNQDKIKDPNRIGKGWELVIPKIPTIQ